jgi:hypothetical protein
MPTDLNISINLDLPDLSGLYELYDLVSRISAAFNDLPTASVKDFWKTLTESPNFSSIINLASLAVSLGSVFASLKVVGENGMKNLAKSLLKALKDEEGEIKKELKEIGRYMGEGLIEGIKIKKAQAELSVEELGEAVINSAEVVFEEESPSKVFARIGKYIAEGLGIGIGEGADYAQDAMKDLSGSVVDSSKSLSEIKDGAKDYSKSLDDVGDATEKVNKKKISFGGAFAIVAGIVTTLVGLFKNLMESNEGFREKVEAVWGK